MQKSQEPHPRFTTHFGMSTEEFRGMHRQPTKRTKNNRRITSTTVRAQQSMTPAVHYMSTSSISQIQRQYGLNHSQSPSQLPPPSQLPSPSQLPKFQAPRNSQSSAHPNQSIHHHHWSSKEKSPLAGPGVS
ncbi:hypothetical protein B9Z55_028246 [Caenorhabditis nigoni]|uniref:Uncharacterized protein n=1 Tax=Caenorhabditis nigoni TaxID=1611254 RepID=A0A2G5SCE6_9PELO|nr:hypothetical protein B9Z55_028246 [Caenorhabditis nigoni]